MATRTCPNCGTQYIATVRRCIDCDASLVDDVAPSATEEVSAEPTEEGERHVTLALAGWGNQLKVTLEGMLDREKVPRAWEAGALVVPVAYRDEVKALISVVEGSDSPDLADEETMIALEIEGLDAAGLEALDGRLAATSIAHAWSDDGELLVSEDDEETVLVLIQEVFDEEGDTTGLDSATALSEFFVSTDRLIRRIGDTKAETAFVERARTIRRLEVPYGLDGNLWRQITDEAEALAFRLAGDEDEEEPEDSTDDADDVEPEAEDSDADVESSADGVDIGDEAEAGDEPEDEADEPEDEDDDEDDDEGDLRDRLIALRDSLRELV